MPASQYLTDLFSLADRTVVVTGGTGVLCGALAEGIAQAGASVVIAGQGEDRGLTRVKSIEAAGGKAAFLPVDVTSRSSVEALLAESLKKFGRVDGLINGAGVNSGSTYFDVTDEDWRRVLDINLTGVHLGTQIFGKHLSEHGGGSIVNLGSVTAHLPLSRVFAYSASKAAVVNLTQNAARELAPLGVRVNAICPGFFPAEQNRKILDAARVENIMKQTPLARFGSPEELIGCTLLLLSPQAGGFITGAAYYVDGGFTAMRF